MVSSRLDATGVGRGAEPRHDPAAEQTGRGRIGAPVDLRRLTRGDERLLRERADAERGRQRRAVGERHLLRRVVRVEAVPGPTAPARPALAAHRAPVEDDEVAGRDTRDVGTDRLHDARGLVAEQEREVVADAALAVVQIGVAHTARLHAHLGLARTGIGHDDRLDRDRGLLRGRDDSAYLFAHGAESTVAITPVRRIDVRVDDVGPVRSSAGEHGRDRARRHRRHARAGRLRRRTDVREQHRARRARTVGVRSSGSRSYTSSPAAKSAPDVQRLGQRELRRRPCRARCSRARRWASSAQAGAASIR